MFYITQSSQSCFSLKNSKSHHNLHFPHIALWPYNCYQGMCYQIRISQQKPDLTRRTMTLQEPIFYFKKVDLIFASKENSDNRQHQKLALGATTDFI